MATRGGGLGSRHGCPDFPPIRRRRIRATAEPARRHWRSRRRHARTHPGRGPRESDKPASPMKRPISRFIAAVRTKEVVIAAISLVAIGLHLVLRLGSETSGAALGVPPQVIPLWVALICGIPLVFDLSVRLSRGEFS